MKLFVLLFALFCTMYSADIKKIEQNIKYNEKILNKTRQDQNKINTKIKTLANELNKEEEGFNKIQTNIATVVNKINANKSELQQAKVTINLLEQESKTIEQHISTIEENIVKSVIDKYTMTIGKNLLNKNSIKDIIEKEKMQIIFENAKETIAKSNEQYSQVKMLKNDNDMKKQKIETFISSAQQEEKKFIELKKEKEKKVATLKTKHKDYQNELKAIVKQQNDLSNLLGRLNIIKETELEKIKRAEFKAQQEKLRIAKAEALKLARTKQALLKTNANRSQINALNNEEEMNAQNIKRLSQEMLENDANMNVRNFGSVQGAKVSSSRGIKMKAPLSSFTVEKRFGEYFDPVYKIKLYNDSVTLRSKDSNEKVFSALQGQVVYAKSDAGSLGNVVILKHAGDIHTIYSRLSQIAPTISVGKAIPQGYVVGRIQDKLVFQATKSNQYLNPEELF